MSAHTAIARAEARVQRWVPATPAAELLREARGWSRRGKAGRDYTPVAGPHLRRARTRQANNRTGVPGISLVHSARRGRLLSVALGGGARVHLSIDTLGANEAWQRAVRLRAAHERRVAAANALILQARARAGDSPKGTKSGGK